MCFQSDIDQILSCCSFCVHLSGSLIDMDVACLIMPYLLFAECSGSSNIKGFLVQVQLKTLFMFNSYS